MGKSSAREKGKSRAREKGKERVVFSALVIGPASSDVSGTWRTLFPYAKEGWMDGWMDGRQSLSQTGELGACLYTKRKTLQEGRGGEECLQIGWGLERMSHMDSGFG